MDINYLRRYVNGELSLKEMYEVERATHDDPMIMDIIIGLEHEKSNKLPSSNEDIHKRIIQRVTVSKTQSIYSWTEWAIAASIILFVGITSYYFGFRSTENNARQIVTEAKANEHTTGNNLTVDSISQPESKILATKEVELNKRPNKDKPQVTSVKTQIINIPSNHEDTLMERQTLAHIRIIPKLENFLASDKITIAQNHIPEIATGLYSSQIEEVISPEKSLVTKNNTKSNKYATIEILQSSNSQSKLNEDQLFQRPEVMRAKLSKMNLDPHTSLVLQQAINQKSQENDMQIVQMDTKVSGKDPTDENYTYLANIKPSDSKKDSRHAETVQGKSFDLRQEEQVVKPTENEPSIGWKSFDVYLGQMFKRYDVKPGKIVFEFTIDREGHPKNIGVKHSKNATSNVILIKIIKEGPIWKKSSSYERVKLEVNL